MLNSQILDVAIGLALMYLFQSILVSGITEVIVSISSWKGRFLKYSLGKVFLSDDRDNSLYLDLKKSPFIDVYYKTSKYPSYIKTEDFTSAVLYLLNSKSGEHTTLSLEQIQAGIEAYPDGQFKSFLKAGAVLSNGDIEIFKSTVNNWFNQYMDRVSTWYKNRIRILTATLAFIITVAINVDSFSIMNELWKNERVRESSVLIAEEIFKNEYVHASEDSLSSVPSNADNLVQSMNVHYNMVFGFEFPITWEYEYRKKLETISLNSMTVWDRIIWSLRQFSLEKILGFLITTAAVTMGTPIWYDLLKKLIDSKSKKKENATTE
jgi:hypothetical protein